MPTTCKVYFNNNKYIVHSGQKIIVTVRLKLTEEIKIRSINIHLHGRTHIHFIKDDCNREGMYTADENVLDMKKCLDAGNGGEIQHMIPGTYDYTYKCILPQNLPSSYYGLSGETTYTAQVTINVPRWPDKTFKESFYVHKLIDLNDFPSLQRFVKFYRNKQGGAKCYQKNSFTFQEELTLQLKQKCNNRCITKYAAGPFNIVARMASSGYVPGQFINLKVDIDNNDRIHAIVIFHVKLLRRVIYSKSENSKHKKTIWAALDKKSASGCQIKQHRTFHVSLRVPYIQPTDTESKLIKIDYMISIIAEMGNYQKDLRVSFPVIIGTERIDDASPPAVTNLSESKIFLPSAPPLPTQSTVRFVEPSAPDDDTVSIRTYASTPPPFPDDEFDLPTYDEALQLDDEFNINLDKIQYSFGQLSNK